MENSPAAFQFLCVEDSRPDFELLEEYLQEEPRERELELTHAPSLEEAKRLLRNHPSGYDLIFLDLFLHDSRGESTFVNVQDLAPDCPVIILTGQEDPNLALKLVQSGAEDFLPKDALNSEVLWRMAQHAMERKRNQVELRRANSELRRLNSELQETRLQLIQAEKLDSLERLASGVAHEVKNPLATLQMGVDYFSRRSETTTDDEKILRSMQTSIERANRIIMDMVDFSRAKDLEFRLEGANLIIRRALNVMEPDLHGSDIRLNLSLEEELPALRVDPLKLEQVIINLLANAIQATPRCGRIEVKSYVTRRKEVLQRPKEKEREEEEVCVAEIRDWGAGIEETIHHKIFDPFFSTKSDGHSTGLGLSVSRTIVSLHDGDLTVENAEGDGVVARVILPLP